MVQVSFKPVVPRVRENGSIGYMQQYSSHAKLGGLVGAGGWNLEGEIGWNR